MGAQRTERLYTLDHENWLFSESFIEHFELSLGGREGEDFPQVIKAQSYEKY